MIPALTILVVLACIAAALEPAWTTWRASRHEPVDHADYLDSLDPAAFAHHVATYGRTWTQEATIGYTDLDAECDFRYRGISTDGGITWRLSAIAWPWFVTDAELPWTP